MHACDGMVVLVDDEMVSAGVGVAFVEIDVFGHREPRRIGRPWRADEGAEVSGEVAEVVADSSFTGLDGCKRRQGRLRTSAIFGWRLPPSPVK